MPLDDGHSKSQFIEVTSLEMNFENKKEISMSPLYRPTEPKPMEEATDHHGACGARTPSPPVSLDLQALALDLRLAR